MKPQVTVIIDKWLRINDQEDFSRRIYLSLVELYTVVRNKVAVVPTTQDNFFKVAAYQGSEPPRFDLIERKFKD